MARLTVEILQNAVNLCKEYRPTIPPLVLSRSMYEQCIKDGIDLDYQAKAMGFISYKIMDPL